MGVATVIALSAAPGQAALAARSISFAAPASTTTGAAITVSGKVTRSPKGTVVVIQRLSGQYWIKVSSVHTTNTAGSYSSRLYVPKSRGTYSYRALSAATRTLGTAVSARRSVVVRTPFSATLLTSARTAANGAHVTLSGKVTPWVAKTIVTLHRRIGSANWTAVATLHPSTTGTWATTQTPASNAIAQYRVIVATNGYYLGTTSPTVSVATPPVIATQMINDATQNAPYSFAFTIADQRAGTWAKTLGSLPAGLNLSNNGVITGTPTGTGTSTFTVAFTDSFGLTVSKQYMMSVDAVGSAPSAIQISAGGAHTCRVSTTGILQCWGDDSKGELGINGDTLHNPTVDSPQTVLSTIAWQQVSASPAVPTYDTCAIKVDHSLWCWGYDFNGEVGQGNTAEYDGPKQVLPGTHWAQVAVGGAFTCAIRTDYTMWCWGVIGLGGQGSAPVQVGTASNWTTVKAGYSHACALDANKNLWCWGSNYRGWLGDGTTGSGVTSPEKIGTAQWMSISTGPGNTCGVETDGTLWCWGSDSVGQLGNGVGDPTGTADDANVPQQVGSSNQWGSVSVSGTGNSDHMCAVNEQLSVIECWGSNGSGELGGTPANQYAGVTFPANHIWDSVSAGGQHTCGTTGSSTYCWGSNSSGQLGVTLTGSTMTPQLVP